MRALFCTDHLVIEKHEEKRPTWVRILHLLFFLSLSIGVRDMCHNFGQRRGAVSLQITYHECSLRLKSSCTSRADIGQIVFDHWTTRIGHDTEVESTTYGLNCARTENNTTLAKPYSISATVK